MEQPSWTEAAALGRPFGEHARPQSLPNAARSEIGPYRNATNPPNITPETRPPEFAVLR